MKVIIRLGQQRPSTKDKATLLPYHHSRILVSNIHRWFWAENRNRVRICRIAKLSDHRIDIQQKVARYNCYHTHVECKSNNHVFL